MYNVHQQQPTAPDQTLCPKDYGFTITMYMHAYTHADSAWKEVSNTFFLLLNIRRFKINFSSGCQHWKMDHWFACVYACMYMLLLLLYKIVRNHVEHQFSSEKKTFWQRDILIFIKYKINYLLMPPHVMYPSCMNLHSHKKKKEIKINGRILFFIYLFFEKMDLKFSIQTICPFDIIRKTNNIPLVVHII